MKIPSALLALALATVAAAQSPSLPTCAKGCADQFISNGIGNCNLDAKCICSDKDFISNISCCVAGACNPADQQSAVAFAAGVYLQRGRHHRADDRSLLNYQRSDEYEYHGR
ncbi:hypothetical protein B0T26DRAFT_751900 [Lasiosphaeria miniovina]|uniref:CFEM domain-containing protein n=1 Tax=Lasiosphaeria miniovina TaxID=1954250 RepID=A0AA40E079_9PEZI|nr:uncharacterized protein B0T26DRAFT_751900 [Lasiosphaeria miniovina]KAK0717903.1 hypothetical protein B0T26DRAFT_751900 [Lasiosphaeria miniovina]